MEKALQLIAALGIGILGWLIQLAIACKVWALVCVPIGLPALDFDHAWGIDCFLSLLMFGSLNVRVSKKMDVSDAVQASITSVFYALAIWGLTFMVFG